MVLGPWFLAIASCQAPATDKKPMAIDEGRRTKDEGQPTNVFRLSPMH